MPKSLIVAGTGVEWLRLIVSSRENLNPDAAIEYTAENSAGRLELLGAAPHAEQAMRLIRSSSDSSLFSQPQTARTLFRLLVPESMRRVFNDSQPVVLEVDHATAGVPWELLDAREPGDDSSLPWALGRTFVRALQTMEWRPQSSDGTQSPDVLVIGEPQIDDPSYARVPGAAHEGQAVADEFRASKRAPAVRLAVLMQSDASEITDALLSKSYRILHISGIGELGQTGRAGIVLSQGCALGASEIAAMICVPELIVVNCGHLGAIQFQPESHVNRSALAASFAEELLVIGARCVVIAANAVGDEAAVVFVREFYRNLLSGGSFAESTSVARQAAWRVGGNTWAAFQCYGDVSWRF